MKKWGLFLIALLLSAAAFCGCADEFFAEESFSGMQTGAEETFSEEFFLDDFFCGRFCR